MAREKRNQRSFDEILTNAARLVAHTIDEESMGISLTDVEFEHFIQYFKEKAIDILAEKNMIVLGIGSWVNTQNDGDYSPDIRLILDYIEARMQIKFCFHYGILVAFSNTDIYANWLPDTPL